MIIDQQLHFPTPIWRVRVENHEQLDVALLEWVGDLRRRHPVGVRRSNLGGWQSPSDLHLHDHFKPLKRIIEHACSCIARRYDLYDDAIPFVRNAWANVSCAGHANAPHVHGGSALSGVYYLQVADGSGDLEFLDPRGAALTARLLYPQPRPNHFTTNRLALRPAAGLLVLFPGWLQHYVHPNASTRERIGFSFNVTFERPGR